MLFTYDNKIIENPLNYSYKEGFVELPKRLKDKNYTTPFDVL